ncbi:MAG: ribonuclease T2 [Cocleimonas sp.]
MRNKILFLMLMGLCSFSLNIQAKDIGGCFQATQSCEAFQSFRKKTNPGNVRLNEDIQYKVLESSKKMKAYRVEVNGIDKSARWVTKNCGDWLKSCTINKEQVSDKKYKKKHKKSQQYLLALTWQPAFCEDRPRKKECRTQTTNRYDAKHWSLHGLWPQPRNNTYCGVGDIDKGIDRNKRWHLLEPVKLSQKTAQALAFTMPGMASNLHRHEWIKHGTCYGKNANNYYADSIYLTEQINNSAVGALFSRNVGKRVSLKEVRQRFDQAFGKGTGKKVNLRCDRKGLISELWINLSGNITNKISMASLLENAIDAGSSCKVGKVDRANK